MIIGVPRERKSGETRVAITPDGAEKLCSAGHKVVIEKSAGLNSHYYDEEYISSGAKIVGSLEEVWSCSELLVKVKEPSKEEIPLFKRGQTIFSFLHLAAFPELTNAMLASGVTGLDYDLLELENGSLPILSPMSVIAGKLSIQCGARALQAGQGGRGLLLGGTESVEPGDVLIIGGGSAGKSAAEVAIGIGANVTLLDINEKLLSKLKKQHPKLKTTISNKEHIEKEIKNADLIIGAVLIPGALAPKLITKSMLSLMRKGTAIVDICIDQGGFAESSRPTTIEDPIFQEENVLHHCVTNMPAMVPRTSTQALTNATISWIEKIAENGIPDSIENFEPIEKSLTTHGGKLYNQEIATALDLDSYKYKS